MGEIARREVIEVSLLFAARKIDIESSDITIDAKIERTRVIRTQDRKRIAFRRLLNVEIGFIGRFDIQINTSPSDFQC